MTYHTEVDYKCPRCGTRFIPYRKGVPCPKCGYMSDFYHPIAEEALAAWRYHKRLYGSGLPPAYYIGSLGDYYIYLTAVFLSNYFSDKPDNDKKYVDNFVGKMEVDEQIKAHFRSYLLYVLHLLRKRKQNKKR